MIELKELDIKDKKLYAVKYERSGTLELVRKKRTIDLVENRVYQITGSIYKPLGPFLLSVEQEELEERFGCTIHHEYIHFGFESGLVIIPETSLTLYDKYTKKEKERVDEHKRKMAEHDVIKNLLSDGITSIAEKHDLVYIGSNIHPTQCFINRLVSKYFEGVIEELEAIGLDVSLKNDIITINGLKNKKIKSKGDYHE